MARRKAYLSARLSSQSDTPNQTAKAPSNKKSEALPSNIFGEDFLDRFIFDLSKRTGSHLNARIGRRSENVNADPLVYKGRLRRGLGDWLSSNHGDGDFLVVITEAGSSIVLLASVTIRAGKLSLVERDRKRGTKKDLLH